MSAAIDARGERTMDFGIVTDEVDELGYITHAELAGYSHCWVTDSQRAAPNTLRGMDMALLRNSAFANCALIGYPPDMQSLAPGLTKPCLSGERKRL